jgi:hypothetical protein
MAHENYSPRLADPIYVTQYRSNMGKPTLPESGPIAFLVCHGMGQQTPFETLDCVVKAICDAHEESGGTATITGRLMKTDDKKDFIPRVELLLRSKEGLPDKKVHLYEAYWAPLTEGEITYRQTAAFILHAGVVGLIASLKGRFDRWIFNGMKWLPVVGSTFGTLLLMLAVLAPLLLLTGTTVWVAYLAKTVFGDNGIDVFNVVSHLSALIGIGVLWLLFRKFRQFVLQFMGDVAIYVSSNEVNRFWRIRKEIKDTGVQLASLIYSMLEERGADIAAGTEQHHAEEKAVQLAYRKVIIVGHSLGSVLAYDTLNETIKNDQVDHGILQIVERTEALITLGSPLDKTAFLFRQNVKNAVVREALSAAVQPLIQQYIYRPRWWINIFSPYDIVAGSLEYYDDPGNPAEPRRVRNLEDKVWIMNPIRAHTGYWGRPLTREILYKAATESLSLLDTVGAKHSGPEKEKKVVDQAPQHAL